MDLRARCDAIEESYEFMLAYAAQGLDGDAGSATGGQLRQLLSRAEAALTGIGDAYAEAVSGLEPAERYRAFCDVIDRDARAALAAVQIVLAQAAISSQLVDNLNANIHLRALLTDLFIIDEILKRR